MKNFSLQLNTHGIYSYLRHPQALALCLLAVGIGLTTLSRPFLWTLPLWILYWVAYTFFEEHFELIPAYGEEYLLYRQRTPRLLPSTKYWRISFAKRRRSFSAPRGA
jgi:protein-S-isoprenylcysteine O-methyltransferase Ste14